MEGEDKVGPFSQNDLQDMLDKGDITASTKVWAESLKDWLPISEIEHFKTSECLRGDMTTLDDAPTITIEKRVEYLRETDQEFVKPRPWVRFWARMIDYSFFILILSLPLAFLNLPLGFVSSFSGMVAIFLWVFVEAFLLSSVGTTPGKWLLRVSVRDQNHHKLSFSEGLNRSFSVWWLGMGAGFPIISFITMIIAAVKLNNTGKTSWDRRGEYRVFHGDIGVIRVLVVILYFLSYIWLLSWGQMHTINQV